MAEVDIKVNLLVIAMMGIALFIAATGLYLVAHRISDYGHLLLPLPAIAVAAYIFVVNWASSSDAFSLRNAPLAAKLWHVFIQALVGGVAFVSITFLILVALLVWQAMTRHTG